MSSKVPVAQALLMITIAVIVFIKGLHKTRPCTRHFEPNPGISLLKTVWLLSPFYG